MRQIFIDRNEYVELRRCHSEKRAVVDLLPANLLQSPNIMLS